MIALGLEFWHLKYYLKKYQLVKGLGDFQRGSYQTRAGFLNEDWTWFLNLQRWITDKATDKFRAEADPSICPDTYIHLG